MSPNESRSLSLSIRCYRGLLRAYPRAFLAEFEELLCQAFADLAHRAVRTKGNWGLLVLWMRTIPDLIASAFSQRFRTTSEWSFRLVWIFACTAGVAITAMKIFGLSFFVFQFKLWLGLIRLHPTSNFAPQTRALPPQLWFDARILKDAAMLGLLLGLFQSFAFRWKVVRRGSWAVATTLGAMASVTVILLVPYVATYLRVTIHPWRLFVDQHPIMYIGGSTALCISIMGILQTLVLARQNPRALAWIPASAVGFLACIPVLNTPALPLVGLVYGLVTVVPLEWILKPRVSEDVVSVGSSKLPL